MENSQKTIEEIKVLVSNEITEVADKIDVFMSTLKISQMTGIAALSFLLHIAKESLKIGDIKIEQIEFEGEVH